MIVTGNRTQRQLISKGWTERNLEGFILARLGFESVGIRFQTIRPSPEASLAIQW